MEEKLALQVHDNDNVATVFAQNVRDHDEITVRDKRGAAKRLAVIGDIPYGHKLALQSIRAGEPVVKYGEQLGVASRDIAAGEYVHVHNLDSMRGRGDLVEKGER